MSNAVNSLYEFGEFRLDTGTGTLWRGSDVISLSPKAAELLKLLIERDGQVVSKKDIFDLIWADTYVEDGVLTQNIYTLRNALGRDAEGKQFIETVPRRGYRFAGQLKAVSEGRDGISAGEGPGTQTVHDENSPSSSETNTRLTTASPTRSPISSLLFAGLALLVLTAAAFGIYQLAFRKAAKKELTIAPIEQLRFQRLTDSGDVLYPTISPKGDLLAYVRHGETEESVWVMQVATGSSVQMLPPMRRGYESLAFSPDGNYLYFREKREGGAIYRTPVFGDTPKKVADNVWSDFSISPDGENLLVTVGSQRDARPVLLNVEVDSGTETEIKTPAWRSITRVLWTPDGSHLIVAARASEEPTSQLWMLGLPDGRVRRLTNDLESYFWTSLSADGRSLVTRQQAITSHLWLLPDGNLKKAKQITSGRSNLDGYRGVAWIANGKIIFSARSEQITDLHSIDADGSGQVQLTLNAGQDNTWPAAARNGRFIVFTSHRTGVRQVWRMDFDGQNQKQLTFGQQPKESAHSPALSPDAADVYFIKTGSGPSSIWKIPIEGGTAVQVSHLIDASAETFLSISPDGKWIAFHYVSAKSEANSDEPTVQIGLIPTDGREELMVFDLPMRRPGIRWKDAGSFDFAAGSFNTSTLMRQRLDGSEPEKLIEFPDRIFDFGWSIDGKDLAVARGRLQGDALLITNLP